MVCLRPEGECCCGPLPLEAHVLGIVCLPGRDTGFLENPPWLDPPPLSPVLVPQKSHF